MKRIAPLVVVLALVVARGSFAQDRIELYADINRTQCAVSEANGPLIQIYVWLTGSAVTRGARFIVPKPACWQGATWVGDVVNPIHTALLDSQRDWSVVFNTASLDCTAANIPPIYIGTVNFFVSGQSLPCCQLKPMPSLEYVFLDCDYGEHALGPGLPVTVNANASCPCQSPVAVEPTTWGRVKSLYR
jgi:hypothetical protein